MTDDSTEAVRTTLGERIRGLRDVMDMDQVEFAALFDTTVTTVSRWENDRNPPTGKAYQRMVDLAAEHKSLTAFTGLDTRTRFSEMLDRPDLKLNPGVTVSLDVQIAKELDGMADLLQVIGKYCLPPLRISSVEDEETPERSTLLLLVNLPDPLNVFNQMMDEVEAIDGITSCNCVATAQGIGVGGSHTRDHWKGQAEDKPYWSERNPRKPIDPSSTHLARTGRTREEP